MDQPISGPAATKMNIFLEVVLLRKPAKCKKRILNNQEIGATRLVL